MPNTTVATPRPSRRAVAQAPRPRAGRSIRPATSRKRPRAGPAATRYRLSRENRRRFLSGERADARHGLERAVERGLAITSSCDSGPIGFRRGRASPTPTPPPPEGKRSHVGHIKAGGPPSASEASCRRRVRGWRGNGERDIVFHVTMVVNYDQRADLLANSASKPRTARSRCESPRPTTRKTPPSHTAAWPPAVHVDAA